MWPDFLDDPMAAWLGLVISGACILVTIRAALRSKHWEDSIRECLAERKHECPEVVSYRARKWGRFDRFRQVRPQPHAAGTYDWGKAIGRAQRERSHTLSGRR